MAIEDMEDTKWKEGESGNPAGRPKGALGIKSQLKKCLKLIAKEGEAPEFPLAQQLLSKAIGRDVKDSDQLKAIDMILDRLEGKAVSTVDNLSSDGSMSPINKIELTSPDDDSTDKPTA